MTNPNDPAGRYLTKREYFAGLAMQGFVTAKLHDDKGVLPHLGPDQIVARAAVVMADALIAELNK